MDRTVTISRLHGSRNIESWNRNLIDAWPQSSDALQFLGNVFRAAGKLEYAIVCYKRVLCIDQNHSDAHYNLGIALQRQGDTLEAINSLNRALSSNPANVSAEHMLSALTGVTTSSAPAEYVRSLFDSYSDDFEHHLVSQLGYRVPFLLRRALEYGRPNEMCFGEAVDLGCGTGLVGCECRSLAERLTGIDLSPRMVQYASHKLVYDSLQVGDVVKCLEASTRKYDLFLAGDVFIYCGDLKPIFEAVQQSALPNAYFAFSTEECTGSGYVLHSTGRYAHSYAYVRSIADEWNFTIESCEVANLRKGEDGWVNGRIFVLRTLPNRADTPT